MICAYCGQEAKGTREHIISSGVLDLFPECFATIDTYRGKIHLGDPVVKDVCAKCNNEKLSYIDSYAKLIISKYFVKKYDRDDVLDFLYDYSLIQKVLIKYAFNDLRSRKNDTSYFTDDIKNFLSSEAISDPLRNVTVLAGLAVNTSPVHDYMYGNVKIRWGKDPWFSSNSIIEHLSYETGELRARDFDSPEEFVNLHFAYVFRFNSAQFLLFCWDEDITDEE